jgi:hypothetical protein
MTARTDSTREPHVSRISFQIVVDGDLREVTTIRPEKIADLLTSTEPLGEFLQRVAMGAR